MRPKVADPGKWNNAIHSALEIHRREDLDKAILESRLLAREKIQDIARRSGLSQDTVLAFGKLFFDVEARYEHKSWIRCQAIGYRDIPNSPTMGAILRKFAYFAGADFLEELIPHVHRFIANPSLAEPPVDLDTEQGRVAASFRRILLLETLPRTEKSAMVLFKLHVTMISQASRDNPSSGEPHTMSPDIEQVLLEAFTAEDLERIQSVA